MEICRYESAPKTPSSETKGNRRKTSFVWDYFRVCEEDVRKAVCNNCGALIVRGRDTRSFSTSSLASHIKYCHRTDDGAIKRMKRKRSSACDVNVLLTPGEDGEERQERKKQTSQRNEEKEPKLNMDEEIETYVYPNDKKDFPPDVICSKRMELIHSGLMMHVLYQQHRTGRLCDLTLISAPILDVAPKLPAATDGLLTTSVKGTKKVFHAHSSILAGVSAKVKTLIEMGSRTIELKDVSAFGLKSLLEIVYTGKLKRKTPLRFFEAHHIWKAASNLGIKYVHEYLANEHPQVAKWIADEERQSQEAVERGDNSFVYEITSEEDQNSDLIDLCATTAPPPLDSEERHDFVDEFEQEHDNGEVEIKEEGFEDYIPSQQEAEQQQQEEEASVVDRVKSEERRMIEITFSKT